MDDRDVEGNKSPFRFPWADMKERLDSDDADWSRHIYFKDDGGYISKTLGAHAEKVKAGKKSEARRETLSYVYHVQSGSGRTEIELFSGEKKTVEWGKSDTFAVPAWSRISHEADGGQDAYLFVLSDMPIVESLDMYVKE